MMKRAVHLYERAMEIKTEEGGNETSQHYESCLEDADMTKNVLGVSYAGSSSCSFGS